MAVHYPDSMSQEVGRSANDDPEALFPVRTEVRLRRANGFRMLGMYEDAETELAKVPLPDRLDKEVLVMKVVVRQDAADWGRMQEPARILRKRFPEAAEWWIAEAYATRRSESIQAAREILIEGEERHENEPGIKFNLACYACRLGDSDTALRYLLAAIALDSKYKEMAFADEDLNEVHEVLDKMWMNTPETGE